MNALWATAGPDYLHSAIFSILAESMTLGYQYMLVYLIGFLSDPDGSWQGGVPLLLTFNTVLILSSVFKNYSTFTGYACAVKIRRTLISALYDKVA